ncbi:TonB-dependent receptor [Pseudomonas putida]|nr:TonB-dependent receptor [Pseudomonas putida]HDS1745275.1 TonB-dependent receptor [Pseudomonas putida]
MPPEPAHRAQQRCGHCRSRLAGDEARPGSGNFKEASTLTATFNVNNLFDRDYLSRVGWISTFNFYGPSRSMMVGARYDF